MYQMYQCINVTLSSNIKLVMILVLPLVLFVELSATRHHKNWQIILHNNDDINRGINNWH